MNLWTLEPTQYTADLDEQDNEELSNVVEYIYD